MRRLPMILAIAAALMAPLAVPSGASADTIATTVTPNEVPYNSWYKLSGRTYKVWSWDYRIDASACHVGTYRSADGTCGAYIHQALKVEQQYASGCWRFRTLARAAQGRLYTGSPSIVRGATGMLFKRESGWVYYGWSSWTTITCGAG